MTSLRRHLLAGVEHDGLPHHPDCPQCRERRLGSAPPAELGGRRAAAVVVTAATLFGSANTGAVAVAQGGGYVVNAPTSEQQSEDPTDGPEEPDDADVDNSEDAPAPQPPPPPPPPAAAAPAAPAMAAPVEAPPVPPAAPVAEPPAAPAPLSQAPPAPAPAAAPAVTVNAKVNETKPKRQRVASAPQPAPASTPAVTRTVASPPAATSRPAAATSAPAASGESHVVRPGESLWSIAKRLAGPGASAGAVARLMHGLWQLNTATIRSGDPDLVHVGDRLRLPAVQ